MERMRPLGQQAPSAATLTDLYTVGNGLQAVISSVVVCNRGADELHFRLSVAVAGAADAPFQYLYWDTPVGPGETFIAAFAGTLDQTDKIRCQSDTANASFNAFGSEVS